MHSEWSAFLRFENRLGRMDVSVRVLIDGLERSQSICYAWLGANVDTTHRRH